MYLSATCFAVWPLVYATYALSREDEHYNHLVLSWFPHIGLAQSPIFVAKHHYQLVAHHGLSVEIRCIENKKFPTARTQSKPRCNLEDGSNEGMIETHP
jgi:hypothetical protein